MYDDKTWCQIVRAYGSLGRGYPKREHVRKDVTIHTYTPEYVGLERVDIEFPTVTVRFIEGNHAPVKIPKEGRRDIILAIDDEPYRYLTLSRQAAERGWMIIPVDQAVMIEHVLLMYGDRILAVMLDHDMPGHDGKEIAENFLIARNLPVIITTNSIPGCKRIQAVLDEYAVPYRIAAAKGMLKGEIWMDMLLEFEEVGRTPKEGETP